MIPSYVVLLFLALAGLLLFYISSRADPWLRHKINRSLAKSCGAFDEAAEEALRANIQLSKPRPRDLYTRGRILQHWVAENNPRHPAIHQARDAYALAVNELAAQDHLDLVDALMLEEIFFAGNAAPDTQNEMSRARSQVVSTALNTATTKLEVAEQALENSKGFRDDPQNVHDSVVVSGLADTYKRIRIPDSDARSARIQELLDSLVSFVRKRGLPEDKLAVITRARDTESYVSGYKDTEAAILASVWNRANDKSQQFPREAKMAVVDSIDSCFEGPTRGLVCAGGRAARYLGALAGIDVDPEIGSAGNLDAYKNEIYDNAMTIIKQYSSLDNPAAKEYAGISGLPEPTVAERTKFAESLRKSLEEMVATYSDKLGRDQIKKLTDDCIVYAMI